MSVCKYFAQFWQCRANRALAATTRARPTGDAPPSDVVSTRHTKPRLYRPLERRLDAAMAQGPRVSGWAMQTVPSLGLARAPKGPPPPPRASTILRARRRSTHSAILRPHAQSPIFIFPLTSALAPFVHKSLMVTNRLDPPRIRPIRPFHEMRHAYISQLQHFYPLLAPVPEATAFGNVSEVPLPRTEVDGLGLLLRRSTAILARVQRISMHFMWVRKVDRDIIWAFLTHLPCIVGFPRVCSESYTSLVVISSVILAQACIPWSPEAQM